MALTISRAVSTQYRIVTDRRTDRQTSVNSKYSAFASCVSTPTFLRLIRPRFQTTIGELYRSTTIGLSARKMLGISWKEHRTNISTLEEIGLERELMGKVARMKLHILRTYYQGKCRKFGTDSLGRQCRWFTSPRKTQKAMDGRHRRVEWL